MSSDEKFGPYIEFKDVSKAFGDNRVLDHVSFSVMPGETVCILGRSGVGKSVSLMNIMGFLKPDSGRVIVAHEDITNYPEEELRRIRKKVTMVFQSGALFDSLTVAENVLFSLELREDYDAKNKEDVVNGLLEMVDIAHAKDAYPADPAISYGWAKLVTEKLIEFQNQEGGEMRTAVGGTVQRRIRNVHEVGILRIDGYVAKIPAAIPQPRIGTREAPGRAAIVSSRAGLR